MFGFFDIGVHAIKNILGKVSGQDLSRLSQVCKQLETIAISSSHRADSTLIKYKVGEVCLFVKKNVGLSSYTLFATQKGDLLTHAQVMLSSAETISKFRQAFMQGTTSVINLLFSLGETSSESAKLLLEEWKKQGGSMKDLALTEKAPNTQKKNNKLKLEENSKANSSSYPFRLSIR